MWPCGSARLVRALQSATLVCPDIGAAAAAGGRAFGAGRVRGEMMITISLRRSFRDERDRTAFRAHGGATKRPGGTDGVRADGRPAEGGRSVDRTKPQRPAAPPSRRRRSAHDDDDRETSRVTHRTLAHTHAIYIYSSCRRVSLAFPEDEGGKNDAAYARILRLVRYI